MADISTYLKQILSAVYGEDVRSAIYNSIKQCYDDFVSGAGIVSSSTTLSIASTSGKVSIPDTADKQTCSVVWSVNDGSTPSFTNFFTNGDVYTYPRELTSGYNQFWSSAVMGWDSSTFDSSHKYFICIYLELDEDSSVTASSWLGGNYNSAATVSESCWIYAYGTPNNVTAASCLLSSLSGSGRVNYCYAIDITALYEELGTDIPDDVYGTFGKLALVPGEDYTSTTDVSATLYSYDSDGNKLSSCVYPNTSITVTGDGYVTLDGDTSVTAIISVAYTKTVSVSGSSYYADVKWVCLGDSLTDSSINADTKYYDYISTETGITVVNMGKGGTGYKRTKSSGTAFYQRAADTPSDADIVTIFGSINDWKDDDNVQLSSTTVGDVSDTIDDDTLCGYINECIDVIEETAPYAHIALITPPPSMLASYVTQIADAIVAVAKYRGLPYLDLYNESGMRPNDDTFAEKYYYDYGSDSMCHPSNEGHRWFYPAILSLLKRMMGSC